MWLSKLKLFNLGGGGISGVRLQTLQIVQGIVIDTKRFSFFLAMDDLTADYFGQSHGIIKEAIGQLPYNRFLTRLGHWYIVSHD